MLNEKEIKEFARLMSSGFISDPGIIAQMGNFEHAEILLYLHCEGQIRAFDQQSAVRVLENNQGLLIGYAANSINEEQLLKDFNHASLKIMETITQEELISMQNNAVLAGEITKPEWYKKYYDGEVFHLMVIVIDRPLKGTGAFRRLLIPVIKECERKEMPIVLQTHNPDNVSIYKHFGFELMEKHTSDKIDLTCFCMMRR